MNWTIPAGFIIFLTAAIIALAQLWLQFLDRETFVKLMITFGILFVIVVAWNLVLRERQDNAKIRNKDELG